MKEKGRRGRASPADSRWRRWAGYALGMAIESAAAGAIALAALGLMLLVKAIAS